MTYTQFLEHVINQGIEGARSDYKDERDEQRLDGSVAGFEACRGKAIDELLMEYTKANSLAQEAFNNQVDNYWWFQCYKLEVEWVLNCVSAFIGKPLLSWLPTANAVTQTARIVEGQIY